MLAKLTRPWTLRNVARPAQRSQGLDELHVRLVLLVLLLAVAAPAKAAEGAAPAPSEAAPSFWQRTRAELQLGLSGRSDVSSELWVMSGLISIDHAFSHGYGIGVDWGFFATVESAAGSAPAQWGTGPGDPWLKVWRDFPLGARDDLHVDVGMTVPAAWLPRDSSRRGLIRQGYAFGAATRGLWNAWLWAPEQLSLAVLGRFSHRIVPSLRLVVEAAAAGAIALSQLTYAFGTVYGQLAPALELHGELLTFGVRAQAVATSAAFDPLQLSAATYLRFEQPHWRVEGLGLCNLDEPLGLLGSGQSVCGALVSFGVQP